jgi:hypothetical protein
MREPEMIFFDNYPHLGKFYTPTFLLLLFH